MARNSTKAKTEPAVEDEQGNANPIPAVEDQGAVGASPCSAEPDGTSYAPIKLVVISARGLALREKPGKQFAMLAVLPTGTVLTGRKADETAEGWIAVQAKDDKAGYVDARFVTVVD